ncbi:hypothetical protein ACIBCN_18845 [Nocardia sp. NPDC051052]
MSAPARPTPASRPGMTPPLTPSPHPRPAPVGPHNPVLPAPFQPIRKI